MTNKRFRVQKLPVHQLHTLHGKIIPAELTHARENTPIIQQPPSRVNCEVNPVQPGHCHCSPGNHMWL